MSTVPQHMAALEKANRLRLLRAQAKRQILQGTLSLADALGLECMASMTVEALLRAQYRCGVIRARKLLSALEISPTRRVEDLTGRQRSALAHACGRRS